MDIVTMVGMTQKRGRKSQAVETIKKMLLAEHPHEAAKLAFIDIEKPVGLVVERGATEKLSRITETLRKNASSLVPR